MYTEVEEIGQDRLSSCWVMTDKSRSEVKKVKARLVCRGFKEPVEVQSDSACGSKETLHLLLVLSSARTWVIKSGDVKNAYLQGEANDREVFMEPPMERKKAVIVWKLRKAV